MTDLESLKRDAARLAEALTDCADDLEAEIEAGYSVFDMERFPDQARRKYRDLEPVRKARAALVEHAAIKASEESHEQG